MHTYGNWPDEKFGEIEAAALFIGEWLRKWGRISVHQTKEKFGTVSVYCHLGWDSLYDIFYPGYMDIRWPKWITALNIFVCHKLGFSRVLFEISYPIHRRLYHWRYKKAINKWPDLKEEILCFADYPELLEDL